MLPRVRFDGGAHGDDEAAHEQVGEEGGGQHEAQHDAVQAVQLHPAHNHHHRDVLGAALTSSRVLASVRSGNKENSLNIQRCKTFCILIIYLRNLLLVNFCHSEVLSFSFQLCVNRYYLKPTVAAEAE